MTGRRRTMKDWLGFIRWPNLALITFFLLVVDRAVFRSVLEHAGITPELDALGRVLLILDILIVTVIGYALNDLFDRDIDSVNRPDRMLVKDPERASIVKGLVFLLLLIGLLVTLFLGYTEDHLEWIWLFPAVVTLLFLYAREGKRWGVLGNVVVSLLIAALPLMWVIAEADALMELADRSPELFHRLLHILGAYFGMMFLSNLGREIVKDLQDLPGDRKVDARSLPMALSLSGLKVVVFIDLLLIATVQALLYILLPRSIALSGFSVLILIMLILMYRWVARMDDSHGAGRVSAGLKWLMLVGVLQLIALPITVL